MSCKPKGKKNPNMLSNIGYEMVDDLPKCLRATQKLLQYSVIAVDIEGISLSREGRICIVQVATPVMVYIFDIVLLGTVAFSDGGLREILASAEIEKLFFDARKDCDALRYQFDCPVNNVMDMQILYSRFKKGEELRRGTAVTDCFVGYGCLPGLTKAFQDLLKAREYNELQEIKSNGHSLFAPNHGGSFEIWEQRPLHPALVKYCMNDVVLLFTILSRCCHVMPLKELREISERRVTQVISRSIPLPNDHMYWRLIDF
jgi:exonuclease 3'-5' domain-containing protein 1